MPSEHDIEEANDLEQKTTNELQAICLELDRIERSVGDMRAAVSDIIERRVKAADIASKYIGDLEKEIDEYENAEVLEPAPTIEPLDRYFGCQHDANKLVEFLRREGLQIATIVEG